MASARCVNLGIKQPINSIIEAMRENLSPHAVGLSGLLVKSTVMMRENLQELTGLENAMTCRCCSAVQALTRAYVEGDCVEAYASGRVAYAAGRVRRAGFNEPGGGRQV